MKRKSLILKILAVALVIGLLTATGAMAEDQTITGKIEKDANGKIILSAEDGENYAVKGQDLSGMVGKTVKVTGTLEEGMGEKSITVSSMEEVNK